MSDGASPSPLWRRCARAIVPRVARRLLRRACGHRVYVGDFSRWAEARAAAGGYDHPEILARTVAAARAVRDGRAQWERDTVLFHAPAPNEPLLRSLRQAAAAAGGHLRVADFGGALGSTWWQHRTWLADLAGVRWSVVEQPALVAAGQREFTTDALRFYPTLAACVAAERPTVVLLSSVLPYLERPHELLAEIGALPCRHVIIDRTGFVRRGRDRLTVQHVPPSIYPGSYPCWFFARAGLLRSLGAGWRVVDEWVTADEVDIAAEPRGMLLERLSP